MAKNAEKRPIKENTYRLLVWLYGVKYCRKEDLKLLWGELNEESRRSLLSYLIKKGWVVKDKRGEKEVITGTWAGREIIERECWLLPQIWEKWDGDWMEVILDNKGGKKEQALWANWRRKLKKAGAKQIVKGVYILPTIMWERFLDIRDVSGVRGVMAVRISGKHLGGVLDIIKEREKEYEIKIFYSRISKQISELLKDDNRKNRPMHRINADVFNIFFQLLFLVKEDSGFWRWQGGEENNFRDLLKQLSILYGKNNELFWE